MVNIRMCYQHVMYSLDLNSMIHSMKSNLSENFNLEVKWLKFTITVGISVRKFALQL